jgi:MFS family permease
MSIAEQPFRWRSIALPAIVPTVLFSIGEGAIIPIIPIVADSLGASLALAGLIAAFLMVGELFGNIPSGWLIARVGERPAMIGATGLSVTGATICVIAPNPFVLGVGILFVGLSAAVFALARHAFMTSFVPIQYRARALSTLGGTFRLGFFVGPFITAGLITLTGTAASAFWVHIAACVGAAIILITLPDPTTTFGSIRTVRLNGRELSNGEARAEEKSAGLFRTVYEKRDVLARMGVGAAIITALRSSRQVILPLWAVSIGLGDSSTALVIGIAGAVDFALFYTGGAIMDRFGRLWTAVPSVLGLGLGHIALAFTHDLTAAATWFVIIAIALAVANGPGSGIIMTLGSDLADPRNPAPFLGAWRLTAGLGGASAPLIIAGVTAVASLAAAAGVIGAIGLIGAAVLVRYVPRYIAKPQSRRRPDEEPEPIA